MSISAEKQRELLRSMIRIRAFEERVRDLFAAGRLPGFVHLSIGQEGVAAGASSALRSDDYVLSTHRGHGHMVAKGADTARMMAELFAKRTGSCKGKGGSMHIADASVGVLGANGVVAGGLSIAAGVGLSIKQRRSGQVCLCFFGDGAANRGPFHEALNLAVIWKLPVVFVCENNGWASSTAHRYACAVPDVAVRAAGYGLRGVIVNGMDTLEVYGAVREAVERARAGGGPAFIEAKVVRWQGHYEGDPQGYRDRAEIADGKSRDPIERLGTKLAGEGACGTEQIAEMHRAAQEEMDRAVAFGESSPLPAPEEALEDLFAAQQ
ncbi:MAG: thiamine pyrophosphate-dependent dehydrogenase E1 component subunit alpha [candidate division NC10 bacterium]|nr:thiamine pyrophosphate-dependent dehydrogenase E1 component subunit alpha [candidate division NC10 bacterium]MBI3086641.1 thiamine pyrophosphate-dependent dehydrogenase E1 component subunit alpha [candidate division NC10 bacterium]